MDIIVNAPVQATDGSAGKVSGILINPVNREVTHIVVKEGGFTAPEVLVPIGAVTGSTPDGLTLKVSRADVESMRALNRTDYVDAPVADLEMPYGGVMYWPYAVEGPGQTPITTPDIPEGDIAIWPGFDVYASDGKVGNVDELVVDAQTSVIKAVVLREGHFWSHKDVTVPVDQIDRIEDGAIHLKLTKDQVGALPPVDLHRPGR